MATLEHLKVDVSFIQSSAMIIRAFDGTHWEVQGKIEFNDWGWPKIFHG